MMANDLPQYLAAVAALLAATQSASCAADTPTFQKIVLTDPCFCDGINTSGALMNLLSARTTGDPEIRRENP